MRTRCDWANALAGVSASLASAARTNPGAALMIELFRLAGPSVILLDELVTFARQLDDARQAWVCRCCWSISASPASMRAGSFIALTSLGVANNLYTQLGLILMIALSVKNGIFIVEMAREGRLVRGLPIREAAL
jgi:AcrB/AcrD/AcrF family